MKDEFKKYELYFVGISVQDSLPEVLGYIWLRNIPVSLIINMLDKRQDWSISPHMPLCNTIELENYVYWL